MYATHRLARRVAILKTESHASGRPEALKSGKKSSQTYSRATPTSSSLVSPVPRLSSQLWIADRSRNIEEPSTDTASWNGWCEIQKVQCEMCADHVSLVVVDVTERFAVDYILPWRRPKKVRNAVAYFWDLRARVGLDWALSTHEHIPWSLNRARKKGVRYGFQKMMRTDPETVEKMSRACELCLAPGSESDAVLTESYGTASIWKEDNETWNGDEGDCWAYVSILLASVDWISRKPGAGG